MFKNCFWFLVFRTHWSNVENRRFRNQINIIEYQIWLMRPCTSVQLRNFLRFPPLRTLAPHQNYTSIKSDQHVWRTYKIKFLPPPQSDALDLPNNFVINAVSSCCFSLNIFYLCKNHAMRNILNDRPDVNVKSCSAWGKGISNDEKQDNLIQIKSFLNFRA